jgi:hypothetical protein
MTFELSVPDFGVIKPTPTTIGNLTVVAVDVTDASSEGN